LFSRHVSQVDSLQFVVRNPNQEELVPSLITNYELFEMGLQPNRPVNISDVLIRGKRFYMVELSDAFTLLHPAIAVVFVLPLISLVTNLAWQTRQRRLEIAAGGKSKIPPVGPEHQRLGRWLTAAVVGLALIGLSHDTVKDILNNHLWSKQPFQVIFYVLLFAATIASLFFLYQATQRLWRGVFAALVF